MTCRNARTYSVGQGDYDFGNDRIFWREMSNNDTALDLSKLSPTVILYRPDTTEGLRLWLCPVSADTLTGPWFYR